ncbi:MAG: transposase, partial [Chloroflexi bacterium]|nr:transposase [Chloroflexota bacterium]
MTDEAAPQQSRSPRPAAGKEHAGLRASSRPDRPEGLSRPKRSSLAPERRSSPRLAAFNYTGPYAYSLTLNTAAHQRAFAHKVTVDECLEVLDEACARHGFVVHAYCFMPNHLHLLIEGSNTAALIPFMKRFKQISSYRYRQRVGRALWHRSYYDHVLRHEDDVSTVAKYIWNNPVRAGLVRDRDASPFLGPRDLMEPDRPEGLSLRGEYYRRGSSDSRSTVGARQAEARAGRQVKT